MKMTERRQMLLALLIKEYVSKALPIGSETLSKLDLGISPATIRNELAALEKRATSPTPTPRRDGFPREKGYRYLSRR